jgi:16S rRNA (adenine1518-N6/adenine1519-N6)-dimethyltransferase
MGVLTKYLLRKDINLKVAEIDEESITYLQLNYPELKDRILSGDFLQVQLNEIFNEEFAVIGNFPYNISTQILFRILESRQLVPAMVGMFQQEVAERIASAPGNREYGILSVLLQPWYEMDLLFNVPGSSFNPPPRVSSAVLRMIRNERKKYFIRKLVCLKIRFEMDIIKKHRCCAGAKKTIKPLLNFAFCTIFLYAVYVR